MAGKFVAGRGASGRFVAGEAAPGGDAPGQDVVDQGAAVRDAGSSSTGSSSTGRLSKVKGWMDGPVRPGSGWQRGVLVVVGVPAVVSAVLLGWIFSSGGDDVPVGSPVPVATATGVESPTVGEPGAWGPGAAARVPTKARERSFAGAVAFAKFYEEQVNQAWMVPDPNLLLPYGLPGCKSCAREVGNAARLQDLGQRYTGPSGTVLGSMYRSESTVNRTIVDVRSVQNKVTIVAADGTVVEVTKQEIGTSRYYVEWQNGHWNIAKIFLLGEANKVGDTK